jgi:hypothetical protein
MKIDQTRCRAPHLGYLAPGVALMATLSIAAGGCGAASAPESTTPERAGTLVAREPCVVEDDEDADVRAGDVDGDGEPEIRHVHRDDVRVCSEYDMNRDGRADVVRFYEADGETPRREEHDFDFDGRLDAVRHYEGGALVRQELDTDFDRYVDTTLYCEGGRVVRAERDRFRRGAVDLWEEYDAGVLASARYDDDRDGVAEKFEYFEGGQLAALGADTDGDGAADVREEVAGEHAGEAVAVAYCDMPAEGAE